MKKFEFRASESQAKRDVIVSSFTHLVKKVIITLIEIERKLFETASKNRLKFNEILKFFQQESFQFFSKELSEKKSLFFKLSFTRNFSFSFETVGV